MVLFFYSNIHKNDLTYGITKKVLSQISTLRKMGHSVYYTCYLQEGVAVLDCDDKIVKFIKYPIANERIRRMLRRNLLIATATSFIQSNPGLFNCIYARYHYFDMPYLKMLKTAKQSGAKVIVEAHSYPCYKLSLIPFEIKLNGQLIFHLMDSVLYRKAKQYVDAVAAMCSLEEIWGIKAISVNNAIDIEGTNPRMPKNDTETIRILSIAYERYAHGFDRIVNGLSRYYQTGGTRDIVIDFVGIPSTATEELVHKLHLDDRYLFHGPKSGKELDDFYNKADLAIGHFGNHRVGSYSGSSIKVSEYLAKGIPFIYAWNELHVRDDFPFALRFPLDETPIDFYRVVSFFDGLDMIQNIPGQIRAYADSLSSWSQQFEKVFQYCSL